MRVVVTGAQGFIGRYVTRTILERPGARVVGIGRSPRFDHTFTHLTATSAGTTRAPLPAACSLRGDADRYDYVRSDVLDRNAVSDALRRFRPHAVIHLASGLRDDPPAQLVRTNVEGTLALLEAIGMTVEPPRIVLGSSGGVYGAPACLPIREDNPCLPLDPYSASKLSAELLADVLARRDGLRLVTARIFNVVGPGQEERHVCGHLARQLIAISLGQPPVVRLGLTCTTRDFVDVRDVARALVTLATDSNTRGIYNVASGNETSVTDLLPKMTALAGLAEEPRVERLPGRPSDVPRHVADVSKLREVGFRQRFSLEDSLADTLDYYRALYRSGVGS